MVSGTISDIRLRRTSANAALDRDLEAIVAEETLLCM